MALCYPGRPPADAPEGERRVFDALATLPEEWKVFYSVAWQSIRRGRPGDGEADFVLLHPGHGLIVIEVKGGGVRVAQGQWLSVDAEGAEHQVKDPYQQATESKRALVAYLRDTRAGLPFLPAGHAVAFPDLRHLGGLGPIAPPEITLTRKDLSDAAAAVRRVVEHWELHANLGDHAGAITDLLAPTQVVRVLLRDTVQEINEALLHLTRDQFSVLDALRRNRRAIIYGPAGTGKTVLAVEKARRLALDGARVLLTCFNRPLAEHLAHEFEAGGPVRVNSFHGLCRWQAGRAGLEFPDDPSAEWWEQEAPALLSDAAGETGLTFDAIVVDEGQDFAPEWFTALQMLLADADHGPCYVFVDSHQMIYREHWEPPFEAACFDLTTNCRNTVPIAGRVAAVFGDRVDTLGASGPDPEFITAEDPDQAAEGLRRTLHALVMEGRLRPDQVVVLTQRKRTCLALRGKTMAGQMLVAPGQLGIAVETIHRFKGLEVDAAVVVLEGVAGAQERALAYTGMSRARAVLYVIGTGEVADRLGWAA